LTLYFSVNKWAYGAWFFAVFAVMLYMACILLRHLPDRCGSVKGAFFSFSFQILSLVLKEALSSGWIVMLFFIEIALCVKNHFYPSVSPRENQTEPP
ncbi:MAG: hypothetical protein AB7E77_12610, partial [Desulfobulbus sp.]